MCRRRRVVARAVCNSTSSPSHIIWQRKKKQDHAWVVLRNYLGTIPELKECFNSGFSQLDVLKMEER